MLTNQKQAKSLKRKDIIDLLVGKEFLVKVPVTVSHKQIFKSEVEDYDLAIKGLSALIAYLKDPKSKMPTKSIENLINVLDDHIEVDKRQLKSGITLGGQIQAKLDKNKQLKVLFQSLIGAQSLNDEMMEDDLALHDSLKNTIEYFAHASSDDEEKINFIIALMTLKDEHLSQRAELHALANHLAKGSDFDTVIYPLFLKIENIKKSNGSGQKVGKKNAEKKFEEVEKSRFNDVVQAKFDAEITARADEHLSNKMRDEIKTQIKNEEKMRVTEQKKANQKKYFYLTREDRDNITQEEINKAIRTQIKRAVGPIESNAIKKMIKLDLFDKASAMQVMANKRHPVLAIYEKLSELITPKEELTLNKETENESVAKIESSEESHDSSLKHQDHDISLPSIEMSDDLDKLNANPKEKFKETEKGYRLPKSNYGLFKPADQVPIRHPSKTSNDTKIENEMTREKKKQTHKA